MQLDDPFTRNKATPTCLSAWQCSQLSLGLLTGAARERAETHVASCNQCGDTVTNERAEISAASYEPVPAALRRAISSHPASAPSRSPWLWRLMSGVTIAATIAGVLIFVRPLASPPPVHGVAEATRLQATRTKGSAGQLDLSISVMRDETLVVDDEPAATVSTLQAGDRLRLRIQGPSTGWIQFEGLEEYRFHEYWRGSIPTDRWLPFGLTITPAGKTEFRVTHCRAEPVSSTLADAVQAGDCTQQLFSF